jgi:hypothetical protein
MGRLRLVARHLGQSDDVAVKRVVPVHDDPNLAGCAGARKPGGDQPLRFAHSASARAFRASFMAWKPRLVEC